MQGQSPDKLNPTAANYNEWYDASIEWDGRLAREIPLMMKVFGPPGQGGIIDAGCGSGRHICALAQKGYRVVGADNSEQMLDLARRHAAGANVQIELVLSDYATLHERVGEGFDGLFCLANSLPAAGTAPAVAQALAQFAACLRPGGRFFIEVLNFTPMLGTIKSEPAAPQGPLRSKSATTDSTSAPAHTTVSPPKSPTIPSGTNANKVESHDHPPEGFQLDPTQAVVTNITIHTEKQKDGPRRFALYPISFSEMEEWCATAGLRIDERWGSFLADPFDLERSIDQIVIGTRKG